MPSIKEPAPSASGDTAELDARIARRIFADPGLESVVRQLAALEVLATEGEADCSQRLEMLVEGIINAHTTALLVLRSLEASYHEAPYAGREG